MEKFIQSLLEELRSQQETKNLIGELSSRITDHRGRVRQLLRSEPLRHPEVVLLIMVGLAADRPLESNFFPGLLEGLLGSLGIAAPGEGNPPHLPVRVLAMLGPQPCIRQSHRLSRRRLRHQEVWGCLPTWTFVRRRISSKKQRHLIPPIFLDPLFIPKMAKAVFEVVKSPVVLKALPPTSSCEVPSTPHQPEDSGLKLEVSKLGESAPSTSQTHQQVQEQTSGVSDTDSGKADKPFPEEEQSHQSLKVKLPLGLLKRSHKATTSGSKDGATPSKVQKESEAEEAEASTLTGPPEAALWKAQFKL